MNVKGELEHTCGRRLCLRFVTPDDAAFIHQLRMDPAYNTHLSQVTGTAQDQRRWIEAYKTREAAGTEFYYVIERQDQVPCGVVRLYDIQGDSFTWGSWILNDDKPAKAALESVVLSFGVGFEHLGLTRALFDVRVDNTHALMFYRRLSAAEIGADEENIYFEYTRDKFFQDRDKFLSIVKGNSEV